LKHENETISNKSKKEGSEKKEEEEEIKY
jgi:hypothetical protein